MRFLNTGTRDPGRVIGSESRLANRVTRHSSQAACRAFTMMELAISLAIIGIALVAIVGVLPLGMNVQKENREATLINQDASVFLEAIRSGSRGLNDLTNYVYAITNHFGVYNVGGVFASYGMTGFTNSPSLLNSGTNIIGLLSTPEFMDSMGNPTNNLLNGGYSNHITAYVRSLSGLAVEKPPDNDLVREGSLAYRIYCVNAPVPVDTNYPAFGSAYNRQLAGNLHELRLTFLWPQQPNGALGAGRQTFRTLVAGQMQMVTNFVAGKPLVLYFYQPQTFVPSP